MKAANFSIKRRLRSFKYALNGMKILIKEECNARIHLPAAVLAIALSVILKISKEECLFILLSVSLVIITEIINSAIENICDFISRQKHQHIKKIKDLSAAAVLVAAIFAALTGSIIFIPKIL